MERGTITDTMSIIALMKAKELMQQNKI